MTSPKGNVVVVVLALVSLVAVASTATAVYFYQQNQQKPNAKISETSKTETSSRPSIPKEPLVTSNTVNCEVGDPKLCEFIELSKQWVKNNNSDQLIQHQDQQEVTCYKTVEMPPFPACEGKSNGEKALGYHYGRNQSEGSVVNKTELGNFINRYLATNGLFEYRGTVVEKNKAVVIFIKSYLQGDTLFALYLKKEPDNWRIKFPLVGGASKDFIDLEKSVLNYIN